MSERKATVARNTNETQIEISVNLDGTGAASFETGVAFLDHIRSTERPRRGGIGGKHGLTGLAVKQGVPV